MSKLLYGDSAARKVSERFAESVASVTALRAIPTSRAVNGMVALVTADNSLWRFHDSCALTGDNILVAEPSDGGSGAWLRLPGAVELQLPFTYATADAAVLLTVPTGAVLQVDELFWKVTTGFTGGSSSAIGVSSSKSGLTTKGDLLGGASGDVAATLVAGSAILGTIGGAYATLSARRKLFVAADTFKFDRITSAFTAGAGSVCLVAKLLRNAGE